MLNCFRSCSTLLNCDLLHLFCEDDDIKKKKVLTALDYTYIYWNFSSNYSIDHYNFKTTLEKLYPYVEVV